MQTKYVKLNRFNFSIENKKFLPPFPSAPNYDAKAWRFIKEYASDGAYFWNVAGY